MESRTSKAFDEIKEYLENPPILSPPLRNKCMKLYISTSDLTIGSGLAQEDDNGVKRTIYHLNRVLNDAETRYNLVENMCLCLYFSCIKLKQYIKTVNVYMSSYFDVIKHMLSKLILHSRIGKWALALSEYTFTYVPLKAMKGQVVVDFIMDYAIIETPSNYLEKEPWKLYFDGSSHKNEVGVGILIVSPRNISTKFKYKSKGFFSNNEVEYEALIAGLEILLKLGAKRVEIKGHYELVVKKITKEYGCIKENSIMYFIIVNRLIKCFDFMDT